MDCGQAVSCAYTEDTRMVAAARAGPGACSSLARNGNRTLQPDGEHVL